MQELVSIITPFHKKDILYLRTTYQSILGQTYPNWEWILCPNNEGLQNENIRFQVSKLCTFFPNEWTKQNNIPYVEAMLIKLSEDKQRLPGIIEI